MVDQRSVWYGDDNWIHFYNFDGKDCIIHHGKLNILPVIIITSLIEHESLTFVLLAM